MTSKRRFNLPACWPWIVWMASVVLLMVSVAAQANGQESAMENPNKVKAAFLRNFAHYVTWPGSAFPDSRAPWRVCILGRDPFGDMLEKTFQGRTEQDRSFEVHRADALQRLPSCQIVFLAFDDPAARRAILSELKGKPVLTVGDTPEFLREGGVIRFQVEDRVRLSINLDQARAASLAVQTRMLEVSQEVVENGVLRKVR
jgi:hypothetical protein